MSERREPPNGRYKITPCPDCGRTSLDRSQYRFGRTQWCVISCGCRRRGPQGPTMAEAVRLWNAAVVVTQEPAEVVDP